MTPLTYQSSHSDFSHVLEACNGWLSYVLNRMFYPASPTGDEGKTASDPLRALDEWLDLVSLDIGEREVATVLQMKKELQEAASAMISLVERDDEKPSRDVFEGFMDLYDELVQRCARVDQNIIDAKIGIDSITGLRSGRMLEEDVHREMERRARRGKPFCLVLARLDHDDLFSGLDKARQHQVLARIATHMKSCVRSFDDIYRTGPAEFVMVLKQSDQSGGVAAIGRFKILMDDHPVMMGEQAATLSYCVAEPMPGDEIPVMLSNMREDLSQFDDESGAALEYFEKSPLERFVDSAG